MKRLRRPVQLAALALLLALPLLSRGSALYEAYGAGARHLKNLATPWEVFLYDWFSTLFGWLDDPAAVAAQFQGGYWSITLFGVTFNDPLAALGHMVARGVLHWPLIGGALFSVALAAVAGRFFCGWICPVNTILDFNDKARRWVERRVTHVRLPKFQPSPRLRYLVLVAGIVVSAVAGFNIFALILPYAALARDWHLAVFGMGMGFGLFFMVVIIVVELVAAPRLWCRALCPTGLVLGWIGKLAPLRIHRKAGAQCLSGCHLCITTCRFGVAPRDQLNTDQCTLCNECVSRCPSDVLNIGALKPLSRRPPVTALVMIMALGLSGLAATDARAHHIKGMPHYGYLENYPQTPTYEKHVVAPPYKMVVVIYTMEGLDRAKSDTPNAAMVYVSLTNTATRKPYRGKLSVHIRPVGGGKSIRRRFRAPLEETVYRMRAPLTQDSYDVVVTIPGSPPVTASVRITLGSGYNWWLMASLGVVIAGVMGVAVWVNRRRKSMAMGTRRAGG